MLFEGVVVNGVALHRLEGKLRCGLTNQIVRTTPLGRWLLDNGRTCDLGNRLAGEHGVELRLHARFEIADVTDIDRLDFPGLADDNHGRKTDRLEQWADGVVGIHHKFAVETDLLHLVDRLLLRVLLASHGLHDSDKANPLGLVLFANLIKPRKLFRAVATVDREEIEHGDFALQVRGADRRAIDCLEGKIRSDLADQLFRGTTTRLRGKLGFGPRCQTLDRNLNRRLLRIIGLERDFPPGRGHFVARGELDLNGVRLARALLVDSHLDGIIVGCGFQQLDRLGAVVGKSYDPGYRASVVRLGCPSS